MLLLRSHRLGANTGVTTMTQVDRHKFTSSIGAPGAARAAGHTVVMGLLESRPLVQVMFLSRFLAGAALTGQARAHLAAVAVGAVAWSSAAVAVYIFNGVMDVAEDRGNGSHRPIASGRLPRSSAAALAGGTAALALGAGAVAGIEVEVLIFLGLGFVYSGPPFPAKRQGMAASVVVAGLGLLTFLGGMGAAQGFSAAAVVFGLVMSGWMGLVGALAKDLTDVPGDAVAGRRTFAVRHGVGPVARYTAVLAVGVAATGLTAAALAAPILLPSMLVLTAAAFRLAVDCRSLTGNALAQPYRSFMAGQYGAVAALGLSLVARNTF
ncbi:UbiA family prenyltransferase [Micromonospora sp. NPDC002296]|uniref:UbiA family prenyltransferase n=1 Tax=Micromonospora sp. NPDC002296 TaxID=3154271 RepID=UPI0033270DE4